MNLVRWSFFPEISTTQRQLNRLFEGRWQDWATDPNGPSTWSPEIDIYETESSLILQADLPGINVKDIDVAVKNNTLTIRGERSLEVNAPPEALHCMERSYGKFVRSFTLPTSVDTEKIEANYKNGVLSLVVPKAERARAKRIQIAANAIA